MQSSMAKLRVRALSLVMASQRRRAASTIAGEGSSAQVCLDTAREVSDCTRPCAHHCANMANIVPVLQCRKSKRLRAMRCMPVITDATSLSKGPAAGFPAHPWPTVRMMTTRVLAGAAMGVAGRCLDVWPSHRSTITGTCQTKTAECTASTALRCCMYGILSNTRSNSNLPTCSELSDLRA